MSSKLKTIIPSPCGGDLIRVKQPNGSCKGCYFNATNNCFLSCATLLYHKEDSAKKGPFWCMKKVFGKMTDFIFIEA